MLRDRPEPSGTFALESGLNAALNSLQYRHARDPSGACSQVIVILSDGLTGRTRTWYAFVIFHRVVCHRLSVGNGWERGMGRRRPERWDLQRSVPPVALG